MTLLDNYLPTIAGLDSYFQHHAQLFAAWLDRSQRAPDAQAVLDYMQSLQDQKYAPGTIALHWAVIRKVYKANGLPWIFPKGAAPQVTERDVYAPGLSNDLVIDLIQASRKLPPVYRGYLALSTTYGMRREELADIRPTSFAWAERLVFVETRKSGRQRYHKIPPEIFSLMEQVKWARRPVSTLSAVFDELRQAAGWTGDKWYSTGWHAIRRTLDTHLKRQRELSTTEVETFLRWRKRGTGSISDRYSVTTVLTKDDTIIQPGLRDLELDDKVFALNPWLPLWGRDRLKEGVAHEHSET